jgi:hypothetical protein
MFLSQSEIAKAFARLQKCGLVLNKKPNVTSALEFLLHGFKYVFPAELGALAVGVPTAHTSPAHQEIVVANGEDNYVWPLAHGDIRGQMIAPLYPQLAEAALKDRAFYDLMSAVEILRIGRSRERASAANFIQKRIAE